MCMWSNYNLFLERKIGVTERPRSLNPGKAITMAICPVIAYFITRCMAWRQSWKTTAHASLATQSAGKSRLEQQIPYVKSVTERWRYFVDFLHDFEGSTFRNACFIFVGLRLVVLIAETFERQGILFILLTLIVHSCFTSCIFAARTLDFAVKFRLVFRYEAVVFRRYVLALLSVGLLRKFEAYLVYLSLIWSKNPRCFSFFLKFRHFNYMLLWFHLVIPSFPTRIDDMRIGFSALSGVACEFAYAVRMRRNN